MLVAMSIMRCRWPEVEGFPTKILPYVMLGNVSAASTQALALRLGMITGCRSFVLQFTATPVGLANICNFVMMLAHT